MNRGSRRYALLLALAAVVPAQAQVVVQPVPWNPSNPLNPHTVISGVPATLAAAVNLGGSGDSFTYSWNFGDGSPATTAVAVTNAYNLSAAYTYNAPAGTPYTAVLTVTDTNTSASYTGNYPVIVQGNTLAARVDVAIDNGLWYLHQTMWRSSTTVNAQPVPWGGWDTGNPGSGPCPTVGAHAYSCSYAAGIDASNTQSFEVSGHLENGPSTDPYTDDVARGLARIMYFLIPKPNNADGIKTIGYNPAVQASRCSDGTLPNYATTPPSCAAPATLISYNPGATSCTIPPCSSFTFDGNGNGQMLVEGNDEGEPGYQAGMLLTALVATGNKTGVARTGAGRSGGLPGVVGQTYQSIVQDLADGIGYCQYFGDLGNTNGYGNGGAWEYYCAATSTDQSMYYYADNSVSQWNAIGLIAAARGFGIQIPPIVTDTNQVWVTWDENVNTVPGQYGYDAWNDPKWGAWAVTPSGMVQMAMDGVGRTASGAADQRWNLAESYYHDNFCNTSQNDPATNATAAPRLYTYGLFSFTKSMEQHDPGGVLTPITFLLDMPAGTNPIDWYGALSPANGGSGPCDGVAQTLVSLQKADGSWYGVDYNSDQYNFETAWSLQMLQKTSFTACVNNLSGVAQSGPDVSLTWTGIPGAAGYSILRSTVNGGPYTAITTTTGTSWQDSSGLASGNTYYYVVQPLNLGGGAICTSNQATVAVTGIFISTQSLPAGTVGFPYPGAALAALGGTGTYTWSVTGLPPGLSANSSGIIAGTPTAGGLFPNVQVTATDSSMASTSQVFSISIAFPPLQITTGGLAGGIVGRSYGPVTLTASGGTGSYTWSVTGLPAVLMASSAGVITGTPAAAGSSNVSVTVTDSSLASVSQVFSLVIASSPPQITTTALPGGIAGRSYGPVTLTASGGTGSYTWSVTGLPAGLTATGGVLSGTPTTAGPPAAVVVTVTDSAGNTAQQTFALTIGLTVQITTSALPGGKVGVAYGPVTLTASGGSGSYTWSISGLPGGLSATSAGVIGGTPATAGTVTGIVVTVTDTANATATASQTFSMAIAPAGPALFISTSALPGGTVNQAYGPVTLAATGGTGAYTWSVTGLPGSLSATMAGVISGTPAAVGTFTGIVVTVTDTANATASQTFSIVISNPALHITTTGLPGGMVNQAYGPVTLAATGGTAPYTWSVIGLPGGLSAAAGVVGGTPTTAGNFTGVMVTVTDTANATASQTFSIAITNGALRITTTGFPGGTAGQTYSPFTLAATGGTGSYTWSVTGLPGGLSAAAGVVSGTPTAAGTVTGVMVTVTDTSNATASQTFSMTIGPPRLPITTTGLPGGKVGVAYGPVTLTATGGTGSYTWSATGLPDGLSLSNTGLLSGTPTTAGSFTNVAITVTDTASATGNTTFLIVVSPAALSVATPVSPGTVTSGQSINVALTATGGQAPYTFSALGTPPAGITVGGNAVSGVPGQPGSYIVQVQVTDSETPPASASGSVTWSVFGFTSTVLAPGIAFSPYSAAAGVAGGSPPYTFSFSSLPPGLSASSSGLITGTVTAPGTWQITVNVKDSNGLTVSAPATLTFTAPASLSVSGGLPAGTVNTAYSAVLSATGGAPPYTWSLTSGALPNGLNVESNGTMSGVPSTVGTFNFGVQATDATGATAIGAASIAIAPTPITIMTPPALATGVATVQYPTQTLTAAGGVPPYTFSLAAGSLPGGLTLDPILGTISGTTASTGTFPFTVMVTDSSVPAVAGSAAVSGASSRQTRVPGAASRSGAARPRAATGNASLSLTILPFSPTDLVLSTGSMAFSLVAGSAALPPSQSIGAVSSGATAINYSAAVSAGASWLSAGAGGTTPGTIGVALTNAALSLPAAATPYQASIVVSCLATTPCANNTQTVTVSLSVTAAPPQLSIPANLISFTAPASGAQLETQGLTVQNAGGGSLGIGSASCEAAWCTVSGVPGSVAAGSPATLTVNADPTQLAAGFYRTQVDLKTSAGSASVPVTLFIAAATTMTLQPSGTQFQSVGGGVPAGGDTDFLVDVASGTPVTWSASVLPGASWLSVTTGSGTATGAMPGTVNFAIDPGAVAALAPQAYYGTIRVTATGVVNTPLDFQVVLNVAPANSPQAPAPSPTGLLFISAAGTQPPAQAVQIANASTTAASYSVSASTTPSGGNWLSVSSPSGPVAPGAAGQAQVSADPSSLTAGVYYGSVTFNWVGMSQESTVNVTLIVPPASQAVQQDRSGAPVSNAIPGAALGATPADTPASKCTATEIVPAQMGLVNSFSTPAGWPIQLAVALLDNCGNFVTNGQVVATFTNGDPVLPLTLANPASGLYAATWTPRRTGAQVTVNARGSVPGFAAVTAQLVGAVAPNTAPLLTPNGTLNVYNPVPGAALAPGTLVQISGTALAASPMSAPAAPLPPSLNGTQVIVGGLTAPLQSVSPGMITAQLPFELTPAMQYQVIVSANGALTTPVAIQLSTTDPGVATGMSGLLTATHLDGTAISATLPAAPGEYIVLTAVGLGLTDTPVADGAPGPSMPPFANALDVPSVTINNEAVTVLFAGLQPGTVGVYQINIQVPADAPNGNLTLVLSQDGNPANSAILPVNGPM